MSFEFFAKFLTAIKDCSVLFPHNVLIILSKENCFLTTQDCSNVLINFFDQILKDDPFNGSYNT